MSSHLKSPVVPCLMDTWHLSESAIYHWLLKQTADEELSVDLLQDTFLRAMQKKQGFCDIHNQKAWLFRVAHNLLIDRQRQSAKLFRMDLFDYEPTWEQEEEAQVDSLAQCLPKALDKLSHSDREIIKQCDLQGVSQQDYATQHELTLVATKARIQRARKKLKTILQHQCHIRFDDQQRVCCFYKE
ncbi:sigma-70 family RNA polymerase sigma factor [Vibrio sp. YIC-376]|uniref:sigma-70 family RNA polymerase sigma factor n=1 Tax=Vibrio sp. YIC-376 TaxID=3136162 RepID=UPI00402ADC1B